MLEFGSLIEQLYHHHHQLLIGVIVDSISMVLLTVNGTISIEKKLTINNTFKL